MKFLAIPLLLLTTNIYQSMAIQYQGTMCGQYDNRFGWMIPCGGNNMTPSCPTGYTWTMYDDNSAFCFLLNTTERGYGLPGTLCGADTLVKCGGRYPHDGCPTGYTGYDNYGCYKNDWKMEDLPGTICGYRVGEIGPTCNGLPVGQCPKGYAPLSDWYFVCVKE